MSTEVEFYGGPADGMVMEIPEDAAMWKLPTPALTPAQLIALENGAPDPSRVLPAMEHIYVRSVYYGKRSGKRLFTYRTSRRAS